MYFVGGVLYVPNSQVTKWINESRLEITNKNRDVPGWHIKEGEVLASVWTKIEDWRTNIFALCDQWGYAIPLINELGEKLGIPL